jgi:hypothetical protein
MDDTRMPPRRDEAPPGEKPREDEKPITLALRAISYPSSHHILKSCTEDVGWKGGLSLCQAPEWTPERQEPISHTLGEDVRLAMTLRAPDQGPRPPRVALRGEGPGALRFSSDDITISGDSMRAEFASSRPIPKRIAKVSLGIQWSAPSGEVVLPAQSENVVYVTMGRPRVDEEGVVQEDGVTVKRMDRAVAWVEPMRTLQPHAIVRALMGKFPYYSLRPSPKVPRQYRHPTYFNQEGGAWPMSDYVEESGECQAIVRLVRAILRQLGVQGEARTIMVWADPTVEGGRTAVSAYWDENPAAGLSRVKMVNGRRWVAALADSPVEEGKVYPASHTLQRGGVPSPGLNRYEACLEFTDEGITRLYGGGAGIFRERAAVLRAFWGLVWVSEAPNGGFRVEEIVTTYRGRSAR